MQQMTFPGFGESLAEKVQHSIDVLREFEPAEGYYMGFSGGKDSCVLRRVADMAGVKYTANYNNPTIDPPELVYFMRKHHPDVIWHQPEMPMWKMAERRGLPTRRMRWCCAQYKEGGGAGQTKILGIRAAESKARAGRWKITSYWKHDFIVCPVYFWSDKDVWQFIEQEDIPVCCLYKEGFHRLGCIGCPMNRQRQRDLERWPRYKAGWLRAARRFWARGVAKGSTARQYRTFNNADEWFDWWLSNKSMPAEDDGCQMGLFQ